MREKLLDEQDIDPIDEAIASVNRQFADPNREPDDDDTQDASDEDDELANDLEASDSDDGDDDGDEDDDSQEEDEQPLSWEDPASPYHQNFLDAQRNAQAAQEAEAQREAGRQLLANIQAAKENAEVRELIGELNEIDPEVSTRVQKVIGRHINETRAVENQSLGYQHGLAAIHMALVNTLGEDAIKPALELARELAQENGLDSMMRRAQSRTQKTPREIELEQQLQALQLRQAAQKSRKSGVMEVDSNPPRRGKRIRLEETETFDDFYKNWEGNPFR